MPWKKFVEKQNPDLRTPAEPDARYYPYSKQLEAHQQRQLEKLDADVDLDSDAEGDVDPDHDFGSPLSSPPSPLGFRTRVRSSSTAGTSTITFPSSPPKTMSSPEPGLTIDTPPRRRKPQLAQSGLEYTPRPPSEVSHNRDVDNAIQLVELLMNPDCTSRITPKKALYHPFLHNSHNARRKSGQRRSTGRDGKERDDAMEDVDADADGIGEKEDPQDLSQDDESEPSDDEFFPHPFGKGVCRKYHFKDDVTEEPFVRVFADDSQGEGKPRMEVLRLESGEGVAIGRQPCEFHRVGYELETDAFM